MDYCRGWMNVCICETFTAHLTPLKVHPIRGEAIRLKGSSSINVSVCVYGCVVLSRGAVKKKAAVCTTNPSST